MEGGGRRPVLKGGPAGPALLLSDAAGPVLSLGDGDFCLPICSFEVRSARGKRASDGGHMVGRVSTYACVLSHLVVSDSAILWTVARQTPLSVGCSGQEHWSGLPFLSGGPSPHLLK